MVSETGRVICWAVLVVAQSALVGFGCWSYWRMCYWRDQWWRVCTGIQRRKLFAQTIVAPQYHAPRTTDPDLHTRPTVTFGALD